MMQFYKAIYVSCPSHNVRHRWLCRVGKPWLYCLVFGLLLHLVLPTNVVNALTTNVAFHHAPAAPHRNPPVVATVPSTTIDSTDDPQAMGYPDGRKVVRDAWGNLYVAYRKKYKLNYQTAYHIFVAKSIDRGHSWQVVNSGGPIETVGTQNQRVPSIAVDTSGTIHVVWYGKDNTSAGRNENQIKYVRSTDQGETWSVWRNIAHVEGYENQKMWQEHPALSIDKDGRLLVVWEGYDPLFPTTTQIKFITSTDGGNSWSVWQNIAPSLVNHSRPTIIGAPHSALYVFAYARVTSRQQIVFARSTDGGQTWSGWERVAPSILEQRHVSAAIDEQGIVHVVWQQQPFSWRVLLPLAAVTLKTELYYATFDGRTWQKPERIAAGQNGAQTQPSISIELADTAQPKVWIAWSESIMDDATWENQALGSTIYAISKDSAAWSAPTMIASGGDNLYPSFARPTMGRPTVMAATDEQHSGAMWTEPMALVWLTNELGVGRIRFTQLNQRQDRAALASVRTLGLQSIQPDAEASEIVQMMEIPTLSTPPLHWIGYGQLTREGQILLFIVIALVGYVLLKFAFARWLATPLDNQ